MRCVLSIDIILGVFLFIIFILRNAYSVLCVCVYRVPPRPDKSTKFYNKLFYIVVKCIVVVVVIVVDYRPASILNPLFFSFCLFVIIASRLSHQPKQKTKFYITFVSKLCMDKILYNASIYIFEF